MVSLKKAFLLSCIILGFTVQAQNKHSKARTYADSVLFHAGLNYLTDTAESNSIELDSYQINLEGDSLLISKRNHTKVYQIKSK